MPKALERIEVFIQAIRDPETGATHKALVTREGYLIGRQAHVSTTTSTAIVMASMDVYIDGVNPGVINLEKGK